MLANKGLDNGAPPLLKNRLVHVTPDPIFAGLDGLHQRMLGSVKMLGRVLILGGIAAAHVATLQTDAQVDPTVSHLETFLATFAARLGAWAFIQMMAGL